MGDVLDGGGGTDVFRFRPREGEDRVRDWTPGEDRIDLRAFGFASRAEALAGAEQVGDDVVLDLSGERLVVTLLDAALGDLRGGDFII